MYFTPHRYGSAGLKARKVVVLTGGPGGGKSTLIEELRREPHWAKRVVFLPEAILVCSFTQVSPREQRFQRLMVNMQVALEEALAKSLGEEDKRAILCHRGSLDSLAYWLRNGRPEEEFYSYTGLSRSEHYQRYTAVLHLVTAALGALEHYKRWPEAHRPEQPSALF